jgi:hypothetical protein
VALKIIKPGMDSAQVIARFEAERQALAMMDHQNIAKVFDAGTTQSGRPFFVMELVHGVPITEYCDANKLTPRQRLELFVPICHAIQHAHQKGIIHRDIKPSNILVTMYDDKPVPKVIDFGVAKAIEQRLTERTVYTQFGTLVGTFEYMSPEQAEMNAFGVDTRSDVYSLGVLLYELLTGSTPLERRRLREAAFDEIRRIIKEEEPPRPSVRLSTSGALAKVAAERQTEPAKLSRLMRGELDCVVMKCLEKDRTRRYETANGLARDIERYLHDEPVEARPASLGYRFGKLARRNKGAMVAVTLVMGALVVGVIGTTIGLLRALDAEKLAGDRLSDVQAARQDAVEKRQHAENLAGKMAKLADAEKVARKLIELREKEGRWQLYKAQMFPMMEAWKERDFGRLEKLLEGSLPKKGEPDFRGWEWYYLQDQCNQASRALKGSARYAFAADWCHKTGRIAVATDQKTIDIWDAAGTKVERTLPALKVAPFKIAWSPQGDRLACFCGWAGQEVAILDAVSGKVTHRFPISTQPAGRAVAWSPDGEKLAIGGWGMDELKILHTRTGELITSIPVPSYQRYFTAVDWHPDGVRLAAAHR